jgi:C1A family cysteine protease
MSRISSTGRVYGWRPSRPNPRKIKFKSAFLAESRLPQTVDLENEFSPCYDQGNLGSCSANSWLGLIERYCLVNSYPWKFRPSRLFAYYNARDLENSTDSDSGASISDEAEGTLKNGVCPEIEGDGTTPDWIWPYDITKFTQKPPDECYKDAVLHKTLTSAQVALTRSSVLNTLASGNPFAFGFAVFSSFESEYTAQTGIMTIPDDSDQFEGGHAVDAVGYVLNTPMGEQGVTDWVKVRNSWGVGWGLNGYFWMPLELLIDPNFALDAHAVVKVGYAE